MIDSIGWNFITQEKGVKYFWPKQGVNMVNKEKEEAAGFQQTRQRELFKELDEILNRLDGINENLMDLFKGQELIKKQLDKIERTTRRRNGYI
tara:strand:- start:2965 stop:3243 length:279 start_codon:yes stop_codon:yes gene_type:complete